MRKTKSVIIPPVFRKRDLWLCVIVAASSALTLSARIFILPDPTDVVLCLIPELGFKPEEIIVGRCEESFFPPGDMRGRRLRRQRGESKKRTNGAPKKSKERPVF